MRLLSASCPLICVGMIYTLNTEHLDPETTLFDENFTLKIRTCKEVKISFLCLNISINELF